MMVLWFGNAWRNCARRERYYCWCSHRLSRSVLRRLPRRAMPQRMKLELCRSLQLRILTGIADLTSPPCWNAEVEQTIITGSDSNLAVVDHRASISLLPSAVWILARGT